MLLALKPVTYGVMHFIVAVAVAFALTGSWAIALGIGLVEPLIQTFAYTVHEEAWSRQIAGQAQPQAGRFTPSRSTRAVDI